MTDEDIARVREEPVPQELQAQMQEAAKLAADAGPDAGPDAHTESDAVLGQHGRSGAGQPVTGADPCADTDSVADTDTGSRIRACDPLTR